MTISTTSALFPLAILLAFLSSLLIALWVKSKARLDLPNHRSSHSRPTPTGGGLGIASCCIAALILLGLAESASYLLAGVGLLLLAITSWRDDLRPLSPILRLAVQAVAACLACLPVLGVNLFWYPVVVIAVMWLINLYNFMDGTDGLAGVQGLLFTLGILVLFDGLPAADQLLLVVTSSAIAAFLVLNWPPARIFMGDVGSTVIGCLFGFIALRLCSSLNELAACIILLAGFITDASWTLIVRLCTKQQIWEAHRLHYYQKMARKSSSHRAPLMTYLIAGLLVQWPLAFGALHSTGLNWIIYLLAAIPLHVYLCLRYKAGMPEKDPIFRTTSDAVAHQQKG